MFKFQLPNLIVFHNDETLTLNGRELSLNPIERKIMIHFFKHNGILSNQTILDLLDLPPKDFSNHKRYKNHFMSNLESKLQGILWTTKNIFHKDKDVKDNRKYYYSLDENFFDIPNESKTQ